MEINERGELQTELPNASMLEEIKSMLGGFEQGAIKSAHSYFPKVFKKGGLEAVIRHVANEQAEFDAFIFIGHANMNHEQMRETAAIFGSGWDLECLFLKLIENDPALVNLMRGAIERYEQQH